MHYGKVLCDEIFGRQNFISTITWHKKRGKDNSSRYFSITSDYILVYAKNAGSFYVNRIELDDSTREAYTNPDNDPRGDYRLLGLWARKQGGSLFAYTMEDGKTFSERLWLVKKENIEGKIRKLGNELEENNGKRNRFEEDLKLLSLGKNISASKINSSLEDLYGLQTNLSEEEKREILSLCVEKIVLKCLTKKGRFKRQMCIRIFSREEFREKIPSSEIIFKLNTHSGAPDWEIISPFKISTGLKKCANSQPQKRHWIRGVMRNKIDFESSGLSMRKYCAKNKIPFSMFQRRLLLLKSLSDDVLEYLKALKLKEETSLCSFRSLYELSSLPKPLQLQRLKDKINYN